VIEQVVNVCQTTIVRHAWENGRTLAVHGWIYGLHDGLLRDLHLTATNLQETLAAYDEALAAKTSWLSPELAQEQRER